MKKGRAVVNLCTYNIRTTIIESDLLSVLKELSFIKWELEAKNLGEKQNILNYVQVLY